MKYLFYVEQNYSFAILRPLQEVILSQNDEVRWLLVGNEVNANYVANNEIQFASISEAVKWKPDVVFAPSNWIPSFIPGFKVAVFHGFNIAKKTRTDDRGHFNIRGCFDLYCTQGPSTTAEFQKRANEHQYFTVKETGWPMLDPLFKNNGEDHNSERKTIILCSTFTESLTCAPILVDEIRRLRDTKRWNWLVQFHPKMPQETVNAYKALSNDYLQFIETDNVLPYLQKADLMVCDTSSVMSMFLMQKKPVVTFRNQSRGNTQHLINVADIDKLESAIEYGLSYPNDVMSKIENYVQQTHPYTDGKSSERIIASVKQLLNGEKANLKRKPINFIRNFKSRLKLNYWSL